MNRPIAFSLVATVGIGTIALTAAAQDADEGRPPIDASQVLNAIERGVAYLRREQSARGHWSQFPGHDGGVTALCTLALLNSGVDVDDPTVARGLEYLRGVNARRTYTVALQTMAFCAGEPKKDFLAIQNNVRWLEENQIRNGERAGAWSYPTGPDSGGDNSNSQFAVLSLYEAQRVGAKVKPTTWQLALDYWRRTQNEDGSWGYMPGDPGSGSMTCAGIGGLVTCSSALEEGDALVRNGRVVCCQNRQRDDALERALDWLGRNFTIRRGNPRMPGSTSQPCLYYYLYGLERTGRLTARRFIGDHDWYREGAEFLVDQQDSLSHHWLGRWHAESKPHISTPMALLFLAKGRRPVVMAKLRHEPGDDWNHHENDAANMTMYTEQVWDLDLTWQVFDIESATVEDLLQAPVLYISGNQGPELQAYATKLRDYVDRGGFLFAEGCCGDAKGFDNGFRRLMADVFPEPEYGLGQVTPGHPLWRMEELVRPESPYVGRLWSVEYGCRTCVVYSEEDLSCYWELARPGRWRNYPDPVVERIHDGLAVGVNVLTYATGREPKGKEQSFVTLDAVADSSELGVRGVIEIAKLRHGGGCNDAPGALANLVRAASQGELRLRIRAPDQLIAIADPNLFRYHLLFMHGRHDFRLTPLEREQLGTYLLERQGTLLADAICASKPFADALRRELQLALPQHSLQAIPVDDPIFTTAFGGYDIRQVTLRDPRATGEDHPVQVRFQQVEPRLEGIKIDDHWAVIFSPFDISCALEKHEAVQCRGYSREDAAKIALNVLVYSLNR